MERRNRYLEPVISDVLNKKMAFIGGPRQVGKTTLSLKYLNPPIASNPQYLSWDRSLDRELILKDKIQLKSQVLVFDEIHKYRNWRSLIKGLYDKYHEDHKFIVTGSARLDHFRRGGDSLLGRYRYLRLHPFTVSELGITTSKDDLKQLLKLGGFPEPFFEGSAEAHRIWQRDRLNRVVNEDLRDLQSLRDISQILLLAQVLPDRVASLLSFRNLAEDLQVSQPTVVNWVTLLSHLYFCFLVAPFGVPRLRAVKKLNKMYLWDWSQATSHGARFENMVAGHLLKYCHWIEDTQGYTMELQFLRDSEGREIDFIVLKDRKPLFAVECKTGERSLSPAIPYFQQRTKVPLFFQVHLGSKDFGSAKWGRVLPFTTFCAELGLV